jgi:hypothetical protein
MSASPTKLPPARMVSKKDQRMFKQMTQNQEMLEHYQSPVEESRFYDSGAPGVL